MPTQTPPPAKQGYFTQLAKSLVGIWPVCYISFSDLHPRQLDQTVPVANFHLRPKNYPACLV